MTLDEAKECNACGVLKPLQSFYKNKKSWDGLQHRCKDCWSLREKAKRNSKDPAERAASGSVVAANHRSCYSPTTLYGGASFTEAVAFTVPFAEERLRLEAETGEKYEIDHILAISLGGKHVPSNLQVISSVDNKLKAQGERDLTHNPYRTKRQPSPLSHPF